ncbi:oxidoreductase [Cylindrobasidium torrendii FP15055 ss-10]|uniref:Oxidoreductase n=1 Tax=Cylindrobasidium torrendii FP15055 ss-10 TaxID=1314674 RepID=A0A0D7BCY7_9AGAR|nr:oxidoreductase [Cylindrobasidium torrendii FP15055 ss-10]
MPTDDGPKLTSPLIGPTTTWSSFVLDQYQSRQPPQPLGTVIFSEYEEKARQKMKKYPEAFMYGRGNAGSGGTYDANLEAFKRYTLVPKVLAPVNLRSVEATLLGKRYPTPLVLGPIGTQCIFAEEGELAPARAGRATSIPFALSTVASRSMEDVAEANGPNGERWFQLYWPRSDDITLSLLSRAKALGYTTLVVTLDNNAVGWRTHDLNATFAPQLHGVGVEVGRSDPVFMSTLDLPADPHNQPAYPYDYRMHDVLLANADLNQMRETRIGLGWVQEVCSGKYRSWEDLKWLQSHWDGPIVLKGILRTSDAETALSLGISGIVVSNHGGRQIDGCIPTMDALASIVARPQIRRAQSEGKFTVFLDSGIRTGTDILKAIALGAQGIFLGRVYLWASAVGGQAGIEQVIRQLMAEVDITLGLLGYNSLDELRLHGDEVLTRIEQAGKAKL